MSPLQSCFSRQSPAGLLGLLVQARGFVEAGPTLCKLQGLLYEPGSPSSPSCVPHSFAAIVTRGTSNLTLSRFDSPIITSHHSVFSLACSTNLSMEEAVPSSCFLCLSIRTIPVFARHHIAWPYCRVFDAVPLLSPQSLKEGLTVQERLKLFESRDLKKD